ncbi:MAG: BsuPI-related putative proteinase inhibitor [Gemmatimonadetes bacterium]|nr:BsuPI-related putative proteinase inhibitor [Gemmatimonadota bacterium]
MIVMPGRAILLITLLGCDGSAPPPPPDDTVAQERTNADTPVTEDSLRLSLEATATSSPARRIRFDVRLANLTDRPLDVFLTGRTLIFDIVVSDDAGREVWRRLHGESLQSILRVERILPRGALEMHHVWEVRTNAGEPVPPGDYEAIAVLPTDGEPLRTPPVRLRIQS